MSERAERDGPTAEDLELYRAHFLRADAAQATVAFAIIIVGNVALLYNDQLVFGWGTQLYALLAVRGGAVATCAAVIGVLLRSRRPRTHDRAIALLLFVFVLSNYYVVSELPPEALSRGGVAMLALSIFYFVVPGPIAPRAAAALLLSITNIWFTRRSSVPEVWRNAMLTEHVFTHILGIVLARRLGTLRRQRFLAQLEERRAREALAKKASDLEAAKARAETLTKAKSDFLASLSHELRTPMNAVLGLSGLLAETPLSSDQRELASTIHDSARELLGLLKDVLDVSRIEAGRMALDVAPFDVARMIRGAVDLMRYQAAEKGLTIDVSIAPEVPAGLLGDGGRLRQILVNLLSNAIKFTDRGVIEVRASSPGARGELREIVLAVKDTGAGISPEHLERLFEPFEQGASGVSQGGEGAGLGLMIVSHLARVLGAALRVDSEVGRGSTFELTFAARPAEPPAPLERASGPLLPGGGRLRILVAEDNLLNQRVALAALARLGCGADVVSNGREAVEAALSGDYDVILMDLRMPEMGGVEAARRILAERRGERAPRVIAMTASAFDDDRAACREAGMVGFVTKPVQVKVLHDALRAVVEDLPSSGPAPAPAPAEPPAGGGVVLSKAALDKLRALEDPSEPGFFVETCRHFGTGAEKILARLAEAVEASDVEAAARAVHNLKSMSASVGALEMSRRCASLETAARAGDLAFVREGLAALREDTTGVERALEREAGGPLR